jgi:hypothetical protein
MNRLLTRRTIALQFDISPHQPPTNRMIDPFNRPAAQYCPNLSEIHLDINHAKALPLAVPARLRPPCSKPLSFSSPRFAPGQISRPFSFNGLHTLLNSQFRLSPLFSCRCALFTKNTGGGGTQSALLYCIPLSRMNLALGENHGRI